MTSHHEHWRPKQGVFPMKVKITMDRKAQSSRKSAAITKIVRDLKSKATISGDVIMVDSGHDEKKVIDILDFERVDYAKST